MEAPKGHKIPSSRTPTHSRPTNWCGQADLLYLLRDVRGESGEPIARLILLGWTCIGNPVDCMQIVNILVNLLRDSVLCLLCYVFVFEFFQSTDMKFAINSSFTHSRYNSLFIRLNHDCAR